MDILAHTTVLRPLFRAKLVCLIFWTPLNYVGGILYLSSCRRQMGGILSICETPEQLPGLENVTGAHIHKAVSSKRVKYQFRVNHPFNNRKHTI